MLNRRHLRIKILQALYAFYQSDERDLVKAEKALFESIEKIYDLYLYYLLCFDELISVASNRIHDLEQKANPNKDELNQLKRLIEIPLLKSLSTNQNIRIKAQERKVSWIGDANREMFKKVLNQIKSNENFITFANETDKTTDEELTFVIQLFKEEIANSNLIYNHFEEMSINWLDDIDLTCSMVIKTIKNWEQDQSILPLYKDPEDEKDFIKRLFRKTVALDTENMQLIDDLTKNWELDRIAKMDILLLKLGITEMQEFNNIPTKVSLNEYIEISKYYSTPKSNGFINGILDNAIARLTKENKIKKIGRGLMS